MNFTTKLGDALHLAEEGIKKRFKRIIAVGGEGTLNDVINGIAGNEVIVGIIPSGLGNDFLGTINPHRGIDQNSISKKIFPGHYAYLAGAIKTILNYKSINIQIDRLTIEEDILPIAVANGKYYRGGMLPAPEADVTDGLFDVCLVKKMTKTRTLLLLRKYMQGKHNNIDEVKFYKSKKVCITSDKDFAINIEGEVFIDKKADFEILPKTINMVMPSQ